VRLTGLYGIVTHPSNPLGLGLAMLEGGCRILQLRMKQATDEQILAVGKPLRQACRERGALFFVNDRPDLAVALNADGVHIGQTDGPTAHAREIVGPGRLIGRSANDLAHLQDPGADYMAFGPVFETQNLSRPKTQQGLEKLRQAVQAVPQPLVAIGGITPETLTEVRATGVGCWAVIGAIAHAADPVAATRALLGAEHAGS